MQIFPRHGTVEVLFILAQLCEETSRLAFSDCRYYDSHKEMWKTK